MNFYKGALAALAIGTLSVQACGEASSTDLSGNQDSDGAKGAIGMALTLPDGSDIDSVTYTITGAGGFTRTGTVPVLNSTVLRFRVGNLVAGDYTIALSATSSLGEDCSGSATFTIVAGQTASTTVTLTCGVTNNVGDLIVDGEFASCPIVSALSAIPAEVRVGSAIALEAYVSHTNAQVSWSGAGGTFSAESGNTTNFTCGLVGTHTLTATLAAIAGCSETATVEVTCAEALVELCGNGTVDFGEECDDGNQVPGDSCDANCQLEPFCGDGTIDLDLGEECDDGNATAGDGCDAACQAEPPVCGNGVLEGTEQCDDGNTTAGDGCSDTCTTEAQFGDNAHQIEACRTCREANCTNFFGVIDLVDQCFNANGNPADAQLCIDVMNCAQANNCAYGPDGLNVCFCGTADVGSGACQAAGAANGPCMTEMYAAAKTTVLAELIGNIGFLELPIGRAFYFAQCDSESCPACVPN